MAFDVVAEANRINAWLKETVQKTLKRNGGVIGVSGGVDSAVTLHLAVQALGRAQIIAMILPDKDSNPTSGLLASEMIDNLQVAKVTMDITNALEALGCYRDRDQAIQKTIPEFDPTVDRAKIVLPQNLLSDASLNHFNVIIEKANGDVAKKRIRLMELREIVAASNLKQRIRMLSLYREAERHNFAVIGTANKNEHDLGFFVKYGDGGVDLQPLAHLYKTQVYELAEYLEVPKEIIIRPPTTDTYSAECTQEEFFYRLPFNILDRIWFRLEEGIPLEEIANEMDLTEEQITNVMLDIQAKQKTTEYLRFQPVFLGKSHL